MPFFFDCADLVELWAQASRLSACGPVGSQGFGFRVDCLGLLECRVFRVLGFGVLGLET